MQERVSGEIHETIHSLEELVTESLDDCCLVNSYDSLVSLDDINMSQLSQLQLNPQKPSEATSQESLGALGTPHGSLFSFCIKD